MFKVYKVTKFWSDEQTKKPRFKKNIVNKNTTFNPNHKLIVTKFY